MLKETRPMQYELQIFEYEDHNEFRILDIDGAPWFVLADVCRALDLKTKNGSFSHHAEGLDADEKRLVARSIIDAAPSPLRGEGLNAPVGASLLVINESGLYSLILGSKKPEAKRFKKWVTSEVLPAIRRTGGYRRGGVPAFIRRYNENWDRIDTGCFSVISELVVRLWGRLEQVGHVMADTAKNGTELRPDVSVGRRFSDWLQEKHPTVATTYTEYMHWTPAGEFAARQYTNSMWHLFTEFVDTVWIPEHARDYFKTRDPNAIPYLPRLLPAPAGARGLRRPGERLPPRIAKPATPAPAKPLHIGRPRPSGRSA
jgi:prophage antirepressor-like protein